MESHLAAQARILATEVAQLSPRELGPWVAQAKGRAERALRSSLRTARCWRIPTRDAETMENHAGRPEVQSAVQGKLGSAVRHSASINRNLLYLALPAALQGRAATSCGWRYRSNRSIAPSPKCAGESCRSPWWRRSLTGACLRPFALLKPADPQVQAFAEGLVAARFTSELPSGPLDELGALGSR